MENTNDKISIIEHSEDTNIYTPLTIARELEDRTLKTFSQKIYEEKVIQIKRVTKVVKGGKRMSFRVILVVGDTRQKVGVGIGRAEDVGAAIQKAVFNGKKSLISVPLTLKKSIPQTIHFSYGAAQVALIPANEGAGIIAGGAVRSILELSGLKNIIAKQQGSKSILNNAKATMLALSSLNETVKQGMSRTNYRHIFYKQKMVHFSKHNLFI